MHIGVLTLSKTSLYNYLFIGFYFWLCLMFLCRQKSRTWWFGWEALIRWRGWWTLVWQPMFLGYSTVYILAWYLWVKFCFCILSGTSTPCSFTLFLHMLFVINRYMQIIWDERVADSSFSTVKCTERCSSVLPTMHFTVCKITQQKTPFHLTSHTVGLTFQRSVTVVNIIDFLLLKMSSLPNGQLVR